MLGQGCQPGSYPQKAIQGRQYYSSIDGDTDKEINWLYKVTKLKSGSTKCPTQDHLILGPHTAPDYTIQILLERSAQNTTKLDSRH